MANIFVTMAFGSKSLAGICPTYRILHLAEPQQGQLTATATIAQETFGKQGGPWIRGMYFQDRDWHRNIKGC